MKVNQLTEHYSVTAQISPDDIERVRAMGIDVLINNRPDGEAADQPHSSELQALAEAAGLEYHYLPVVPNQLTVETAQALDRILSREKPTLAFCRTGNRSTQVLELRNRIAADSSGERSVQVLVVGGGAGGLATAASLLKRDHRLDVAIVEPKSEHYYQPGWTLVGGGVFSRDQTIREMAPLIPRGARWIKDAVQEFQPETNRVLLESGRVINYQMLVVSAGIKLDWDRVEGLSETLGQNGVTSNYNLDTAPQTWRNIQALKSGRAVFTQPPMPIKCAGAPQKAMYLAADHWLRSGNLKNINIDFYNAGGVLFGVQDYVPALEKYVEKYGINLEFNKNLVVVDGPAKKAFFENTEGQREEVGFDMLHVSPPQCAPDFVKPLANEAGWVDVDQATLRHTRFDNVYSLGDICSTPNAKTAAAVRKQAPVVAHNLIAQLKGDESVAIYDGYGSCPLIVERGKVVLAEFGYGGKLLPTMPLWLLNGKQPTWAGWFLKATMLPPIYFDLMLQGREWLAAPEITSAPRLATT